jgi:hypothetical protein
MSNQIKINRNEYYKKFAMVSVNQMVMSDTAKCYVCKTNLQEFTVFLGESQRLSTLYDSCCSKCLPEVIKKANKEGIEEAEKQIKAAEEKAEMIRDAEKYNL